jgi:hypothetical protein
MSNAIDGTNYATIRPFTVDFTSGASTNEQSIVSGSYVLCATQDCVVKFGATGLTAAAALASTQPSAAATFSIQLRANIPWAIDLAPDLYLRVYGNTAAGKLDVHGPIGRAAQP